MIQLRRGDLLKQNAEALVNAVNCVGVMGRGIALQFRKAFPENFKIYEAACKRGEVKPGEMLVFDTHQVTNPRYIINFPTKCHWRDQSRITDIESGLEALAKEVHDRGILSIAVPALGCGLGGLKWSEVRPRIEKAFAKVPDVQVWLFEPEEMKSSVVDKSNLSVRRA
jgi:O-acetyl-ADP-ribose deacetylase (regulator of RNase III)